MEDMGVITHKGSIVDASFIDVPRQRNTRKENEIIKEGGIPEEWLDPTCLNMLEQKDVDARWAKKNEEVHFGYKDHILCDVASKMIIDYRVTAASVHDSKALFSILTFHGDKLLNLWADSAYIGELLHAEVLDYFPELSLHIVEKGTVNHPLTDIQKSNNCEKSRVRARIEHIFGYMSGSMNGMFMRSIGIERARCNIALKNLTYNLMRYVTLMRLGRAPCMT
jgi:IS5 family transposase